MIELKNVSFSYGERPILDDFSLTVKDGQCVCLKGPSGCGKTTVLRLALGFIKPQTGTVSGAEKPSVVFQEDRLLNGFSLKTNVLLPPLTAEQQSKAIELLKEAGVSRIVTARELSLKEIYEIYQKTGMEIESFCDDESRTFLRSRQRKKGSRNL